MRPPHATKYEGLGNDFIVVEVPRHGREQHAEADAAWARRVCDRHFGVGADGLLLVDPSAETPSMTVINADGSVPEMCGNGLRCVALHYSRKLNTTDRVALLIDTGAGPHTCEVVVSEPGGEIDRASVAVEMAIPSLAPSDVGMHREAPLVEEVLSFGGHELAFTAVSMGNPHAVTFRDEGSQGAETCPADRFEVGPALQASGLFEAGVNVGFVSELTMGDDGALVGFRLDVLERGAGWTLACGTGACAAAVAAVETGRAERHQPLEVRLPGGPLIITVGDEGDRVRMSGPATHVFDLELAKSLLWRPSDAAVPEAPAVSEVPTASATGAPTSAGPIA